MCHLDRRVPCHPVRQQLKTLETRIEALRGASASMPKFSFKRKVTKPKPSKRVLGVESPLTGPQSTLVEPAKTLNEFSHRYLTIHDIRSANSAEVSISDLDSCIVNMLPSNEDHAKITAFHVQRVSRSVILLPQITGSIILHDLSDCVIVVGCHQVR